MCSQTLFAVKTLCWWVNRPVVGSSIIPISYWIFSAIQNSFSVLILWFHLPNIGAFLCSSESVDVTLGKWVFCTCFSYLSLSHICLSLPTLSHTTLAWLNSPATLCWSFKAAFPSVESQKKSWWRDVSTKCWSPGSRQRIHLMNSPNLWPHLEWQKDLWRADCRQICVRARSRLHAQPQGKMRLSGCVRPSHLFSPFLALFLHLSVWNLLPHLVS